MHKLIIFSLAFLGFIFVTEAKKVKGQILYLNDTVDVIFNIPVKFLRQEPNYERLQQKVIYYDSNGVKRVLKPDDAKEIRFRFGHDEIRMLSRENTLGIGNIFSSNSNIFLRIEIDGKLKLFYCYLTHSGMYNPSTGMAPGASYSVEKFVLQRGERTLKIPADLNFKNDMVRYFYDCPELSQKIERKEFRKSDISAIVKFYNQHCN